MQMSKCADEVSGNNNLIVIPGLIRNHYYSEHNEVE